MTSTTFAATGSTVTTSTTVEVAPFVDPTTSSGSGSGSGTLPFTGGASRDLVSVALLLLAAGLLLLGQYHRRRNPGHEG